MKCCNFQGILSLALYLFLNFGQIFFGFYFSIHLLLKIRLITFHLWLRDVSRCTNVITYPRKTWMLLSCDIIDVTYRRKPQQDFILYRSWSRTHTILVHSIGTEECVSTHICEFVLLARCWTTLGKYMFTLFL